MSRSIKGNQKHLADEDRAYIEDALGKNLYFKEIAKYLLKDPTTISKEVKKRRHLQSPSAYNNTANNLCVHRKTCKKTGVCASGSCHQPCRQCKKCNAHCKDFVKDVCRKLLKAPFVCNGCDNKISCRLEKYYYRASTSQRQYLETLSSARQGINMSESQFSALDELISPLVKQGQSIAHIFATHKEEIPILVLLLQGGRFQIISSNNRAVKVAGLTTMMGCPGVASPLRLCFVFCFAEWIWPTA